MGTTKAVMPRNPALHRTLAGGTPLQSRGAPLSNPKSRLDRGARRVRLGEEHDQVGFLGVGDVRLRSGEMPAVVLASGDGTHRGDVGAGIGARVARSTSCVLVDAKGPCARRQSPACGLRRAQRIDPPTSPRNTYWTPSSHSRSPVSCRLKRGSCQHLPSKATLLPTCSGFDPQSTCLYRLRQVDHCRT